MGATFHAIVGAIVGYGVGYTLRPLAAPPTAPRVLLVLAAGGAPAAVTAGAFDLLAGVYK